MCSKHMRFFWPSVPEIESTRRDKSVPDFHIEAGSQEKQGTCLGRIPKLAQCLACTFLCPPANLPSLTRLCTVPSFSEAPQEQVLPPGPLALSGYLAYPALFSSVGNPFVSANVTATLFPDLAQRQLSWDVFSPALVDRRPASC